VEAVSPCHLGSLLSFFNVVISACDTETFVAAFRNDLLGSSDNRSLVLYNRILQRRKLISDFFLHLRMKPCSSCQSTIVYLYEEARWKNPIIATVQEAMNDLNDVVGSCLMLFRHGIQVEVRTISMLK